MKILRITTRLFPDIGGPAKQAYILSEFCSKKKITTYVITCKPKNSPNLKVKIVNSNFIIYYLPFSAPGINSSLFIQLVFLFKFLLFGASKAINLMRNEKISIIHGHSPAPTGLLIYILSKILKIPYIYSIHGLDYPNSFSLYLEIKLTIKNSEKTLSVNRKIKRMIEDKFNLNNVIFFPNSISLVDFFHVDSIEEKIKIIQEANLESILQEHDYIISYIGHMIFQQKVQGMIDFLHAFQKFLNKRNNQQKQTTKLIYIGAGKFSFLLKDEIKRLSLDKNVFMLGERDDVANILAVSDLLGLTSYVEGFPNVILEAMASKVPCIVSNVGEIQYMIGDHGFIVEPGKLNDMQSCIDECYNHVDEKRNILKENVYEYVKQNFDITTLGKKLINLYMEILKRKKL